MDTEMPSHDRSEPPWNLEQSEHSKSPPTLGSEHFCVCIWQHLPPTPFVIDNQTLEPVTIWTPRADLCLSVLWFHSCMHVERGGNWTENHDVEVLSVLLGHRLSLFDFYARIRYMRTNLPQCWVEASMANAESTMVTEMFGEIKAKWEMFAQKFVPWSGYRCDLANNEQKLLPIVQWDRVVEMSKDMEAFSRKSEDQPEHIDVWLKWWINRR